MQFKYLVFVAYIKSDKSSPYLEYGSLCADWGKPIEGYARRVLSSLLAHTLNSSQINQLGDNESYFAFLSILMVEKVFF